MRTAPRKVIAVYAVLAAVGVAGWSAALLGAGLRSRGTSRCSAATSFTKVKSLFQGDLVMGNFEEPISARTGAPIRRSGAISTL
jgi:hypothetical protein